MKYFTADSHFTSTEILKREFRPFKTSEECDDYIINKWNEQLRSSDDNVIYHLGDFITYNDNEKDFWENGLSYVSRINAPVVLIVGNNEERVIKDKFDNSFSKFRDYCLDLGFKDVLADKYITLSNLGAVYLCHYPDKHKDSYLNLFGHTHKWSGISRPFGLNVGCDLYYLGMCSEKDLLYLKSEIDGYVRNS